MTRPRRRSHLVPRTPEGWTASLAFLGVFLLAMPPISHVWLDRPERWILGVPLFFIALLVVYTVLILILLWALRRGL